jgi:hypothetical protein
MPTDPPFRYGRIDAALKIAIADFEELMSP